MECISNKESGKAVLRKLHLSRDINEIKRGKTSLRSSRQEIKDNHRQGL